jgi:hypothetical protein
MLKEKDANHAEQEKLRIGVMDGDLVSHCAMLVVFDFTNTEKCAKHVAVLLKRTKKVIFIVQNALINFKLLENYREKVFKGYIYLINLSINLL